MNNILKIHRIKKIDNDINILNTIDNDIDILIIDKIKLYEYAFDPRQNGYNSYVQNIFKNVCLPMTLKHLIIVEFKLNRVLLDIEETLLIDIFNNLKIPINCIIDAKYSYYDRKFDKHVKYYSSLNNEEEDFEINKNNFALSNRNKKFYDEYYKYVKK
jgi:hypothetical protein